MQPPSRSTYGHLQLPGRLLVVLVVLVVRRMRLGAVLSTSLAQVLRFSEHHSPSQHLHVRGAAPAAAGGGGGGAPDAPGGGAGASVSDPIRFSGARGTPRRGVFTYEEQRLQQRAAAVAHPRRLGVELMILLASTSASSLDVPHGVWSHTRSSTGWTWRRWRGGTCSRWGAWGWSCDSRSATGSGLCRLEGEDLRGAAPAGPGGLRESVLLVKLTGPLSERRGSKASSRWCAGSRGRSTRRQ